MRKRPLTVDEQPHVLWRGLQAAAVIGEEHVEAGVPLQSVSTGVPHGVRSALVYLDNLVIRSHDGERSIYFCNTRDYVALACTFDGADGGEYPPHERTRISSSAQLPCDGPTSALARVSVNGFIDLHIERFGVRMPKIKQLEPANA